MRKSTAQSVRAEYEGIKFKEGESVEDFSLRLTNLVQRLAVLGDPEPQHKVVRKYLRVAKPRYKQLVVSMETLLDIDTLSVEEVTGRLQAGADDVVEVHKTADGKLLLTQDEWLEKYKAESGRGGSSSGGRGKPRGRGRGRAGGQGDTRAGGNVGRNTYNPDACKNCGKKGHWAKDCRSNPKNIRPMWPKTTSPRCFSPSR
jgi:hypothetical protein